MTRRVSATSGGRGDACGAIARAGLIAAVLACMPVGGGADQTLLDFDARERALIAAHGPWPPPTWRDPANRADGLPAAVRFGRALFFDRRLSAGARMSCADCHRPARAFQDGLPRAQGRGEGRRNTPALLDLAGQRWFGWDGAHDSLWAASLAPLLDAGEMAQRVDALAATVRASPDLRTGFARAFGAAPGDDDERVAVDLAKALAAYQATLVSARTPFDDFRDALLRGDRVRAARYPAAAQRGLRLFLGRGRCHLCHAGPAFSNGEFADIGVPHFTAGGVDPGRHGGLLRLAGTRMSRLGPYNDAGALDPRAVMTRHVVLEPRHFGEFKVPGLRQLVHTAPYLHDGSLATLEDVVRHYSRLDEERLHGDGERILRRLDLSEVEQVDLVAFLRSLGSQVATPER